MVCSIYLTNVSTSTSLSVQALNGIGTFLYQLHMYSESKICLPAGSVGKRCLLVNGYYDFCRLKFPSCHLRLFYTQTTQWYQLYHSQPWCISILVTCMKAKVLDSCWRKKVIASASRNLNCSPSYLNTVDLWYEQCTLNLITHNTTHFFKRFMFGGVFANPDHMGWRYLRHVIWIKNRNAS